MLQNAKCLLPVVLVILCTTVIHAREDYDVPLNDDGASVFYLPVSKNGLVFAPFVDAYGFTIRSTSNPFARAIPRRTDTLLIPWCFIGDSLLVVEHVRDWVLEVVRTDGSLVLSIPANYILLDNPQAGSLYARNGAALMKLNLELRRFDTVAFVSGGAISAGGDYIVENRPDGVYVLNPELGYASVRLEGVQPLQWRSGAAVSASLRVVYVGRRVYVGLTAKESIQVYSSVTGALVHEFEGIVGNLSLSPSGNVLLAHGGDSVRLHDAGTGELLTQLRIQDVFGNTGAGFLISDSVMVYEDMENTVSSLNVYSGLRQVLAIQKTPFPIYVSESGGALLTSDGLVLSLKERTTRRATDGLWIKQTSDGQSLVSTIGWNGRREYEILRSSDFGLIERFEPSSQDHVFIDYNQDRRLLLEEIESGGIVLKSLATGIEIHYNNELFTGNHTGRIIPYINASVVFAEDGGAVLNNSSSSYFIENFALGERRYDTDFGTSSFSSRISGKGDILFGYRPASLLGLSRYSEQYNRHPHQQVPVSPFRYYGWLSNNAAAVLGFNGQLSIYDTTLSLIRQVQVFPESRRHTGAHIGVNARAIAVSTDEGRLLVATIDSSVVSVTEKSQKNIPIRSSMHVYTQPFLVGGSGAMLYDVAGREYPNYIDQLDENTARVVLPDELKGLFFLIVPATNHRMVVIK